MPRPAKDEQAVTRAPLRLGARMTAAVAACWVAEAGTAAAFPDTGYPSPGSLLTPGDLSNFSPDIQQQIAGGRAGAPPSAPEQGWTILPRVDVSEAFNDNIFQTNSARKSDFITYITPSVQIQGNEPSLQTNIFYAPTGIIYASHGGQDIVAQNFNGNASITVVPEAFFVDLRGYAAVQPTFGGLPGVGGSGFGLQPGVGIAGSNLAGSNNATLLTRSNAEQSETFSITPYVVHRFGTTGTVKAGYSYSYTNSSPLSGGFTVLPGLGAVSGVSGSLNTQTEVLQFTSGEDFGRFRNLALLTGNQFQGTGVTSGAYEYIATNQLGYAITRQFLVYGELGAESIHFGGMPATNIDDAVWAAGAEWTPDPDSSVTVGYGHKYGFDSALLNAVYAPTARTRLFAQYQTGLGTDLTQLQSSAINSEVDPFGNSVDPTTGAPLYLANNVLGVTGNTNLYRTKTFTGTGTLNLDRDTILLQLFYEDQQAIATTNTVLGGSTSGFTGTLGWQHQINEDTTTSAYVSYGRQNGNQFFAGFGAETDDTYSAQASIRYRFTETLSGVAQYTFVDRVSNIRALSFTQNVFLIGISKQF